MEKRLQRSRDKKVIAGIGGGLGNYLDIDPVIIRVIFVLFTIFHGIGIIVYIIAWIVIPDEPYNNNFAQGSAKPNDNFGEQPKDESNFTADDVNQKTEEVKPTTSSSNGRIIVGVILILVGLTFLSERFLPFFDLEFVFAIGMVVLGLALIFNFFNKSEKS